MEVGQEGDEAVIIACVVSKGRTVELHGAQGVYWVEWRDVIFRGWECNFPNRAEATTAFLRVVGYPIWEQAGERAYQAAKEEWQASHTTLASVSAKEEL